MVFEANSRELTKCVLAVKKNVDAARSPGRQASTSPPPDFPQNVGGVENLGNSPDITHLELNPAAVPRGCLSTL